MGSEGEKMFVLGFDIGGTKCTVSVGKIKQQQPEIVERRSFATPSDQKEALRNMLEIAENFCGQYEITSAGISAGGPMDAEKGIFMNPPNLPGWNGISWTAAIQEKLGIPTAMENDANACALAEWLWGAGKGCQSMAFLTFGTGLGAGLILDGKLYRGACGNAGEIGHWRLSQEGPCGYGKIGSFEGFCSGGGIKQIGETIALRERQIGDPCGFDNGTITAKSVCEAASQGDPAALECIRISAEKLGKGLALLIDILNPERIVIGSIYARQEALFREEMMCVLREETLADSLASCRIVPAELGDRVGDFAALAVAYKGIA